MLNARVASPRNRRVVVTGPDGAAHWSAPHDQEDLPDPICAAGFLSLPQKHSKSLLLFSNPDSLTRADGKDQINKDRRNVTVRMSTDQGATWPVKRALEPGRSGYSDLAALPNGDILCFYESAARFLTLARFNPDWLTGANDSSKKNDTH